MIKFKLAISFFLFLFISGDIYGQDETLSFLHITDTHLIFDLDFFHPDLAENRKGYGKGVGRLTHFVEKMPQKTNSSFVVVTGDLIDFYKGETDDDKMLGYQLEQYVGLTEKSLVPFYFTIGNHDIVSYSWKNGGRASTQDVAGESRALWVKNAPCFKNGTYYSKVFEVGETKYRFIFLDDGYNDFSKNEHVNFPYIDMPQLHWLEGQLEESDNDVEIISMHIPFSSDAEQTEGGLFPLLAKYPSVKMILAGHNHKNDIAQIDAANGHEIVQVRTGAFAQDKDNWRQIKLTDKSITISAPGSMEKEMKIKL